MSGTISENTNLKLNAYGELKEGIAKGIQNCDIELLKNKYGELEQKVKESSSESADEDLQYYYNLLKASFYPDECTESFIVSKDETYWQVFWAVIAFLKLGDVDSAMALLPHTADFNRPRGNSLLLRAVCNITQWYRSDVDLFRGDAQHYFALAKKEGISERLIPVYDAYNAVINDDVQPTALSMFYYNVTLHPTITFTVQKNPNK